MLLLKVGAWCWRGGKELKREQSLMRGQGLMRDQGLETGSGAEEGVKGWTWGPIAQHQMIHQLPILSL